MPSKKLPHFEEPTRRRHSEGLRCFYCDKRYDPAILTEWARDAYPSMCPRCAFIAIDIKHSGLLSDEDF